MKVLMLAPNFFGYDKRIKKELEKNNIEVDLFDEFSSYFSDSFIKKVLRKFFKGYLKKIYFERIYKIIQSKKYDLIFIIKGDEIPESFFLKIKKYNIKLVSYHWDEIERYPNFKKLSKFFNKILTYNKYEAQKYGYVYLPFFYSIVSENNRKIWDISFIGGYREERYDLLNKLYPLFIKKNNKLYIKIYLNKIRYYIKFLFLKDNFKLITNKEIDYNRTMNIFSNSNAIIEIINKNQNVTTTRSIESIGLKVKVITTLKNIIEYDFYNENNFYILDKNFNFEDLYKWLKIPYKNLSFEIKEKYKIENWAKNLIKEFNKI